MAYTTTADIYNRTPLTETDIDSTQLEGLILDATAMINKEINSKVVRERILPIDSIRENEIDGINKKYYLSKSKDGVYLGDLNNDGEVTIDDIIVYLVNADDTETEATVVSVDHEDLSFTLDEAPSSNTQAIYVTYCYSYFDVTIPDILIEMATRYLTASYAFTIEEFGLGKNVKVGNISVSGLDGKTDSLTMYQKYIEIINKIKSFGNTKNLPVRHYRI
jgi:hypothetical protein